MDLLAQIVDGLELRSTLFFRAHFGRPFAVRVPEDRQRIRFHIAGPGRSWVGLPTGEQTVYGEGDLILIPHGAAHVLASEPTEEALDLDAALRARPPESGVFRHGPDDGPGVELACGHFAFDETVVHPLIETLPPLVHLRATRGHDFGWVLPLLEAAEREARMDAPANEAVSRRIAEILFIQILRATSQQEGGAGLLCALGDPHLARALEALHGDPAADWSVEALAATAGVSRSVFAERFRDCTGTTPMRYLASWRIRQARMLLEAPDLSVGEIARRVGYASEAAFNRAFRDVVGEPPGRHRRTRQALGAA